jgi:hypothetical protein
LQISPHMFKSFGFSPLKVKTKIRRKLANFTADFLADF